MAAPCWALQICAKHFYEYPKFRQTKRTKTKRRVFFTSLLLHCIFFVFSDENTYLHVLKFIFKQADSQVMDHVISRDKYSRQPTNHNIRFIQAVFFGCAWGCAEISSNQDKILYKINLIYQFTNLPKTTHTYFWHQRKLCTFY